MADLFRPRYIIRQIADATGIPGNTIRSWYQRGHIRQYDTDMPSEVSGQPTLYSEASAIAIGIIGALVASGIKPEVAGQVADAFISGSRGGSLFGEPVPRQPAELFEEGMTVTVVHNGPNFQPMFYCVKGDEPISRLLSAKRMGPRLAGFVVALDEAVMGVKVRLAQQPRRRRLPELVQEEVVA